MPNRSGAPEMSNTSPNCSNLPPIDVPAPAVVSSSNIDSPGDLSRQELTAAAIRSRPDRSPSPLWFPMWVTTAFAPSLSALSKALTSELTERPNTWSEGEAMFTR